MSKLDQERVQAALAIRARREKEAEARREYWRARYAAKNKAPEPYIQCLVCRHPQREEIEKDILLRRGKSGRSPFSARNLERKYNVCKDTFGIHRRRHMAVAMAQAARDSGEKLVGLFQDIAADTERLLRKAERSGNYSAAVAAVRSRVEQARLALEISEAGRRADREAAGIAESGNLNLPRTVQDAVEQAWAHARAEQTIDEKLEGFLERAKARLPRDIEIEPKKSFRVDDRRFPMPDPMPPGPSQPLPPSRPTPVPPIGPPTPRSKAPDAPSGVTYFHRGPRRAVELDSQGRNWESIRQADRESDLDGADPDRNPWRFF